MTNVAVTELTETTSTTSTDLMYVVLDPSGTPLSRKIENGNYMDSMLQQSWGSQGAYGATSYATGSAISITKPGTFFGTRYMLTGNTYTDGATIAEDDIELVNCKFLGPLTITGDNVRIRDCSFASLPSSEDAISITGADNVVLDGIHLKNIAESGIVISGSTNVMIDKVTGGAISTDYSAAGLNATTNPEGDAAVIRIIAASSNIQVSNVQMTTCDADGIDVADATDVELVNCKFGTVGHVNNQTRSFDTENRAVIRIWDSQRVKVNGGGCDTSYGHGVFVRETSTGINKDVEIANGQWKDCLAKDTSTGNYTGVGISGRGCVGMVVRGNSITGCGRGGIQFTNDMANPIIDGNYLYGNGLSSPGSHGDAIDTANTHHAVISNNVCKDSWRNGITIKHVGSGTGNTWDVTCMGNVCVDNGSDGIHLEDVSGTAFDMGRVNVIGNVCSGNGSFGIGLTELRMMNIYANTGGNNVNGLLAITAASVDIHVDGLTGHSGTDHSALANHMIRVNGASTNITFNNVWLDNTDPVTGAPATTVRYGIQVQDADSRIRVSNLDTRGFSRSDLFLTDTANLEDQNTASVQGYATTTREQDTADT